MPLRLASRDYRIIGVTTAVAAVSLLIGVKYFWRAFPEAAIDLRVNRDDSARIAEKFLDERGLRVDGYRHAGIFEYDDETKLYLERTQGLDRMNQLTRDPIHLWRWSHRWFKAQQKEEFRVDVSPAGDVVGFDHEIPESLAGENLDQAEARRIAERFLSETGKRDLGGLEFVEGSSQKRPTRTDHTFTWKQRSVKLGDGSLRVQVTIDGDQVAGYTEFVKVPEQWSRDYERLRSRNESAQIIDEVFWVLLSVAMLVILVVRLRDRDVPARMALGFGLVAAVLYFLGQVNTFSLAEFSYKTTDPYPSFMTNYFTSGVLSALGVGTAIFLLVASAEPMYREGFPGLVSLRRYLTWKGLRTRSFFIANVVGVALTFFFFAYQTVFYLVADKLGAWAPSDIPFTNELNTRIPWVSILFMGFFPAVSEEIQFRAFAIPFLKKVLRSWPLALILSAFNWGFLHAAYPNQPFFIRGIEVGLGGVVTGLIMLRFGIMATMIWHYSVDALYTAFLLLRSSNHYLMMSGGLTAAIMLVPLIVATVAYLRTGTFADESTLTNASEGVSRAARAEAEAAPEEALAYRSLSRQRLMLGGVLAAIFVTLAFLPVYRFGRGIKVRATRHDAERTADAFLEQQRITSAGYNRVAWLHDNIDPLALRYLLERRSVKESDQIYRQATRLVLWEVRYFRPLQKEEHRIYVDAAGQVFGYRHILDENASGASLPSEEARTIAEKAVVRHGYQLSDFEPQDSSVERRKARQDYAFVWQAKRGDPRDVGDAHYRLRVEVAGDQVVAFSRFFKLPEDWLRQRAATRLANSVLIGLRSLLGVVLGGAAIILFVTQVRRGAMAWKASAGVGALLAVLMALGELNRLSTLEQAYPTSISLSAFWLSVTVSFVVVPIVTGLAGWVVVALAASLYPEAWRVLGASARAVWRRDALIAIVVSLAAAAGLTRLEAVVADAFHAYAPIVIDFLPAGLDSSSPGLGFFVHALLAAIFSAAMAAVGTSWVLATWRRRPWWFWLGLALLLVGLGPSGAHSVREYVIGWGTSFVTLLILLAVLILLFRDNVAAYLGVGFCLSIADPLVGLLSQPAKFFSWNGVLLAGVGLLLLAWLLAPWAKAAKPTA